MANRSIPMDLFFLCKVLSPWTSREEIEALQQAAKHRQVDWEAVASYANRATLGPALRQALIEKGLWGKAPAGMRGYLDEIYRFNAGRNESLRQELLDAAGLLNNAGIVPLLLKGSAALATDLFSDPAVRFMWDLDLLIPEAKLHRAVAALEDGGYAIPEKYSGAAPGFPALYRGKHYAPMIRPGDMAPVELHRRVLKDEYETLLATGAVWRESVGLVSGRLPGVALASMSPTHQVIQCFAHCELAHDNHRLQRLDLRQLHHFAHLCRRWKDQVDWEAVDSLRKMRHTGRVLGAYLHLAGELFGVETPVSRKPDPYARRHLSRVLFFMDGKWKGLRLSWEMARRMGLAFSGERMKLLYPVQDGDSLTRWRLRRLGVLLGRYCRPGPWKALIHSMAFGILLLSAVILTVTVAGECFAISSDSDQIPDDSGPGVVTPPPVTPPPVVPPSTPDTHPPITQDATVTGDTAGITVGDHVTVTLSSCRVTDPVLGSGAVIDGGGSGVVAGIITGSGAGGLIINAVIDAAAITNVIVGPGCRVTRETVANMNNAGIGLDLTGAVRNPGGVIPADAPILVDHDGTEMTVFDLVSASVNALLFDSTCSVRTEPDGTAILSARNLHGVVAPGKITKVETTGEENGAKVTDTGELVIIQSGIAITLAPDCYDSTSFRAALTAVGASVHAEGNGIVIVDILGGFRVALRFSNFGVLPVGATASSARAEAVFSMAGTSVDPESDSLQATYPDGTVQNLPPFIHDLDGFKSLLDANGITCRFNPANGVFDLMDQNGNILYRGRPAYYLSPVQAGITGLTIEAAGDVNGDDLIDFYLITTAGKQAIFSLVLP